MNYEGVYSRLIERARHRNAAPPGYTEKHHVLPKSMGGSNEPENIVVLTGKEHYIAHWLLFKIHRSRAMALAWYRMTTVKGGRYTSRTFDYARAARAKAMSGKSSPFFGRKITEEHRQKLSLAKKGKKRGTPSPLLGRRTTEAHRRNVSKAVRGRVYSAAIRERLSKSVGNETGVVGVRRSYRKWRASIFVNGRRLHLGQYKTFEAAAAARRLAEYQYLEAAK